MGTRTYKTHFLIGGDTPRPEGNRTYMHQTATFGPVFDAMVKGRQNELETIVRGLLRDRKDTPYSLPDHLTVLPNPDRGNVEWRKECLDAPAPGVKANVGTLKYVRDTDWWNRLVDRLTFQAMDRESELVGALGFLGRYASGGLWNDWPRLLIYDAIVRHRTDDTSAARRYMNAFFGIPKGAPRGRSPGDDVPMELLAVMFGALRVLLSEMMNTAQQCRKLGEPAEVFVVKASELLAPMSPIPYLVASAKPHLSWDKDTLNAALYLDRLDPEVATSIFTDTPARGKCDPATIAKIQIRLHYGVAERTIEAACRSCSREFVELALAELVPLIRRQGTPVGTAPSKSKSYTGQDPFGLPRKPRRR